VVVVQADAFNASAIQTVVVATITSNMWLAQAPGNVRLPRKLSRLPKDSVVNVSQVITLDRSTLTECVTRLPDRTMAEVDAGLKLVLDV
jgi:mRNA interferase MazF